jgi:hypothetical protein
MGFNDVLGIMRNSTKTTRLVLRGSTPRGNGTSLRPARAWRFGRYVEWAVDMTMTRFIPSWSVVYFDLPNSAIRVYCDSWRLRIFVHRNWLRKNTDEADREGNDWYTVPCSLVQQMVLPQISPSERPEFKNHTVLEFLKRLPLPVTCTDGPYPFSVIVRWRFGNDYQIRAPSNPYLHKILVVLQKLNRSESRKYHKYGTVKSSTATQ